MKIKFNDVTAVIEGETVEARIRHRARKEVAKNRDRLRRAAREFREDLLWG